MNFDSLVQNINAVHETLQAQAAHAVNLALTARNWLIGYYIVEFEQHGDDRAAYGEKLLKNLEMRVQKKGLTERRFREFRRVYIVYPQLGIEIVKLLSTNGISQNNLLKDSALDIRRTSAELEDKLIRRTSAESMENTEWMKRNPTSF